MGSLLPMWVPRHGQGTGAVLSVVQWDLTSCLPQNHWYVSPGGPVAQQVRDTCVPSAATCDSGCTVMRITSWTAGEERPAWTG